MPAAPSCLDPRLATTPSPCLRGTVGRPRSAPADLPRCCWKRYAVRQRCGAGAGQWTRRRVAIDNDTESRYGGRYGNRAYSPNDLATAWPWVSTVRSIRNCGPCIGPAGNCWRWTRANLCAAGHCNGRAAPSAHTSSRTRGLDIDERGNRVADTGGGRIVCDAAGQTMVQFGEWTRVRHRAAVAALITGSGCGSHPRTGGVRLVNLATLTAIRGPTPSTDHTCRLTTQLLPDDPPGHIAYHAASGEPLRSSPTPTSSPTRRASPGGGGRADVPGCKRQRGLHAFRVARRDRRAATLGETASVRKAHIVERLTTGGFDDKTMTSRLAETASQIA